MQCNFTKVDTKILGHRVSSINLVFFFWSNSINLVEPLVSGEELAETNWVVPIFKHDRFNILF